MHETFARLCTTSLTAQIRMMTHVHIASVDQLTYEEFVRSVPTPTTFNVINMDPLRGNAILEIDPAITFAILDRLMGGCGEGCKFQHELTDIELSIMEGVVVRLLGNLREAWTQVIDLRPRLGQIDTNPQFAQIVPPTDMVVLVTMEVKVGDVEGMMNFCIPYITIEDILGKLSAEFWYSGIWRRRDNYKTVKAITENLEDSIIPIRAEYFNTIKTLKEIRDYKNGDIIFSDRKKSPELEGDIIIDNFVLGKFELVNQSERENQSEKIMISKIEKYNRSNYMTEKNNVNFDTGENAIKMQVICELGRTQLRLGELKAAGEGTIIELTKLAGEPVDVFVNNVIFAKGEVVVIDENFGVRLVEIIGDYEDSDENDDQENT